MTKKNPTTKKKNATRKATKRQLTTAVHVTRDGGESHLIGIGNLRVIIVPDSGAWFAQGLEIDYAVQGATVDDAKKKFEDGLSANIQEHLKVNGNIEAFLQVAPNEVWKMLFDKDAQAHSYSQISEHHVIKQATKFDGINYLVAMGSAA
jgi:hypothetical protein